MKTLKEIQDAINSLDVVKDEKSISLFCADVAELVLPVYEKEYPNCKAPRECIEAVRLFADGKITKEELLEKRNAAYAAVVAAFAAAAAYWAAYWAAAAAYWAAYWAADAAFWTVENAIKAGANISDINTLFVKHFKN